MIVYFGRVTPEILAAAAAGPPQSALIEQSVISVIQLSLLDIVNAVEAAQSALMEREEKKDHSKEAHSNLSDAATPLVDDE